MKTKSLLRTAIEETKMRRDIVTAAEKIALLRDAPNIVARMKQQGLIRDYDGPHFTPEQIDNQRRKSQSQICNERRRAEERGDLVALANLPPRQRETRAKKGGGR